MDFVLDLASNVGVLYFWMEVLPSVLAEIFMKYLKFVRSVRWAQVYYW